MIFKIQTLFVLLITSHIVLAKSQSVLTHNLPSNRTIMTCTERIGSENQGTEYQAELVIIESSEKDDFQDRLVFQKSKRDYVRYCNRSCFYHYRNPSTVIGEINLPLDPAEITSPPFTFEPERNVFEYEMSLLATKRISSFDIIYKGNDPTKTSMNFSSSRCYRSHLWPRN